MSDHFQYNYSCPRCGNCYLPIKEDEMICPDCGIVAEVDESRPTAIQIAHSAYHNIDWPVLAVLSLADMYMIKAMKILRSLKGSPTFQMPSTEAEINEFVDDFSSKLDFSSGENQRNHAKAFIKVVVKEFLKLESAPHN